MDRKKNCLRSVRFPQKPCIKIVWRNWANDKCQSLTHVMETSQNTNLHISMEFRDSRWNGVSEKCFHDWKNVRNCEFWWNNWSFRRLRVEVFAAAAIIDFKGTHANHRLAKADQTWFHRGYLVYGLPEKVRQGTCSTNAHIVYEIHNCAEKWLQFTLQGRSVERMSRFVCELLRKFSIF